MKFIDLTEPRYTSLSLRTSSRKKIEGAINLLAERGYAFSEQELLRQCLAIVLKLWKGRGEIAKRNTTYNHRVGSYEVVSFYMTEHLRRTARARAHHAGISVSRMVDFAIVTYIERIIESWLRQGCRGRFTSETPIWRQKYTLRHNTEFVFSNYHTSTVKPINSDLEFTEKVTITTWPKDKLVLILRK